MHPPDKEKTAPARAALKLNQQRESYQIKIPKQGKSGRPAMHIPVIILREKHKARE
ncbi:MAG: hypothetical protein KGI29_10110 [Pseudomonadota bacterium]|nr:hypothetical protein [Pseudomonadota bacterium]